MIIEVTRVFETTEPSEAEQGVAVFTGARLFPNGVTTPHAAVIIMVSEKNAPFIRRVLKPDAVFAVFTWEAEAFIDDFMGEVCQTVVCRPYQVGVVAE